jgi:hypothetical protein
MPNETIYDEPSTVSAEDGAVSVEGPDAVDLRLTPEAAEQTGENLIDQAVVARGQRRLGDNPHKAGPKG